MARPPELDRHARALVRAVCVVLLASVLGCGEEDRAPASAAAEERDAGSGTPIRVRVGDVTIGGRLSAGPTARALADELPLRLVFRDHDGVERTGALPRPLPVDHPSGAHDPAAGDIGCFAPGGDLVLHCADAPAFDGIVAIGTFDRGTAALDGIAGDVTMEIERAG